MEKDLLQEEFKSKIHGKAKFNLIQEYNREQRELNLPFNSPSENDLIEFAVEKGLIGENGGIQNLAQIEPNSIELPKSLQENEEEIVRLKKELSAVANESSSDLRSRIYALEMNRYRFSSHGGPSLSSAYFKTLQESGKTPANSPENVRHNQIKFWDGVFARLRRDSGFPWSTALDRVLGLLWEELSKAINSSLKEPSNREGFEPQLTARALFLAALLQGTRHQDDSRDRADDRGQTLIRIAQACELSEDRIHELLIQEFFHKTNPERHLNDQAGISSPLKNGLFSENLGCSNYSR